MEINYTEKPRLYVGCALTYAPPEFIETVEQTKQLLSGDWEVMRFLGLSGGTSADVYNQDIEQNVRNCDAFLGIADYPATGLGWELGVADERNIPTLVVVKAGVTTTRLVYGASECRSHVVVRPYQDEEDIVKLAKQVLLPMVK